MAEPTNSRDDARAAEEQRIRELFKRDHNRSMFSTEVFYEWMGKLQHVQDVKCAGHSTLDAALACAEASKDKVIQGLQERFTTNAALLKAIEPRYKPAAPCPKFWIVVAKTNVDIVEFVS